MAYTLAQQIIYPVMHSQICHMRVLFPKYDVCKLFFAVHLIHISHINPLFKGYKSLIFANAEIALEGVDRRCLLIDSVEF